MSLLKRLSGGLGVFVAITLLAPLAALVVLGIRAASQSPLESAAKPEPLIASVGSTDRALEVTVAIAVEYGDAFAPASGGAGTLTTVDVAAGDTVKSGQRVATVNNADVTAYESPTPLWRDLYRGLAGPDVQVAQRLMTSFGYYSGPIDGSVGLGTERGFKAFNRAHGYGADNGTLGLASVVWLGSAPVTIADVSVAAGDSISPGAKLFTTTSSVAVIKVTEPQNVVRDQPVDLVVGDVATPYEVGSGRITDPAAVAAIAKSLGTATDGVGTIRLATPLTVGTVPSSAVVSGSAGVTCIFPDLDGAPIVISPVGGSIGTIDLDPSLVGQSVLVNPREVREDLSCG